MLGFDDMLFNLHERLAGTDGAALAHDAAPALQAPRWSTSSRTPTRCSSPSSMPSTATARAPLFLVGDPKQAIYSFRHADLHTYLRARGAAQAEYTLAQNQRSSQALLEALNGLFGANPRAFMLDGLDYRPVQLGERHARQLLVEHAQPSSGRAAAVALPRGGDGQPLLRAEAHGGGDAGLRRRDRAAAGRGPRRPDQAGRSAARRRRHRRAGAQPCAGRGDARARWRRWAWAASSCRRPASSTAPTRPSSSGCSPRCWSRRASRCCAPRWPPRRWAADAAALQALAGRRGGAAGHHRPLHRLPRDLAAARRRPDAAPLDARRRRQRAGCWRGPTASAA